ncbi:hypothetical protein CsSME_00043202 [Camellia sinensis var. sinensis]
MDVTFFESQSYFLSSPVSQSSLQREPWCEEIPGVLPISEPLPIVEDIAGEPQCEPAIGNTYADTFKKQEKVYVRNKKRQQIT